MPFYSLLVTSCSRDDLLEKTISSYLQVVDIKPREIIICDNGPKRPIPPSLNRYKHLGVKWINEGSNRGQIYACDRLWQECKYDYAFWCEEDWEFTQGDFIVPSIDILEKFPQVVAVAVRNEWHHPLIRDNRFPFKIAEPNWKGKWGGFTFNPGLRRKSDYIKIGTYGKHVGYGTAGLGHEVQLSKLYGDLGYVIAALPSHCVHIGGERSVACNPIGLLTPPKVLIAVPVCRHFDYGKWESANSPKFDKNKAWKNEPYGTDIHISGCNTRIETVRETWFRDVPAHKNLTAKFFFGEDIQNGARHQLEDEVYLRGIPDDYIHLPQKTIAICKWALEHGFDYLMKCDDDTYIYVDRLMTEVLSQPFDWAGYINGRSCAGGAGYWLSKRAMEEVVRNPIEIHWAEDVTIGIIMRAANIPQVSLPSHRSGTTEHWFFPNGFKPELLDDHIVTAHAVQPGIMREWYAYEQNKLIRK